MKIILNTVRTEKKQGYKTVYTETENETREITEQEYNNITSNDTVKFFRRLGGSETLVRSYTCAGYKVVKLTSTSPDKETKVIRTFKFECE